jgi:type II secretory pathway component GspD/PulD (secretin)
MKTKSNQRNKILLTLASCIFSILALAVSTAPIVANTNIPQVTIKVRFVEVNDIQSFNIWNLMPSVAAGSAAGILTDSQFKSVLRTLHQKTNGDLLSEAQITTLSGRQAQIQIMDENQPKSLQPWMSALSRSSDETKNQYALDVIPTIASDGYTISLTITPMVTEFLGFDGLPEEQSKLVPTYRLSQITISTNCFDGQTLVLGQFDSFIVHGQRRGASGVRESAKDASVAKKKQLLVFITPTIIDPAGNRVHSPEEMPLRSDGISSAKP